MGIQINGQTDTVTTTTAGGRVTVTPASFPSVSNLNATGIVTATGGFSGNVTGNVNATGLSTFSGGLLVGTGASISSPATNVLTLGTNNVERIRVDSSGRLGIGTNTSLVDILTVNDTNPKISIRASGTERAFLQVDSSTDFIVNNKSISNLIFKTSDTERARFNSTGAFVLAGGSTSANGIGIAFPATQSASTDPNTLDDYEEGTWTPGISGRTVNNASGWYRKIGSVVMFQLDMGSPLSATISGADINITGLPFTSANINQVGAFFMTDVTGFNYGAGFGDVYGRVNASVTTVQLLQKKTDGSSHDAFTVGGGIVSTTFTIRGLGWYTVA